ncbi:hypothetical protein ACFQ1M_10370 [Sungkyunkwania multivorans]|uniref:Uncharacterized protein n=1 Tax=Sungkyunkwania multivorans TaxID=1173618 RepID=A0ABW3D0E7_9FLAO
MKKIIIVLLVSMTTSLSFAQDEACKIVGEISLPAVEAGAFFGCMSSANALACKVAFAAHNCGQDIACSGVVATIVEEGCKFTIRKTGQTIEIIGTAAKENAEELRQTYNALNTVEGMTWLMLYLSQ